MGLAPGGVWALVRIGFFSAHPTSVSHNLQTDCTQRMNNASQVNGKWLYFRLFYSLGGKSTVCSGSYFLSGRFARRGLNSQSRILPRALSPSLARGMSPGMILDSKLLQPSLHAAAVILSRPVSWHPGLLVIPQPPPPAHGYTDIPELSFEHVPAFPSPTQMLFPRRCQGARGRVWVLMPTVGEWVGGGLAGMESFDRSS